MISEIPPREMDVLVVIDMQPRFEAAQNKQTIEGCKQAIVAARHVGDHIIFVEYVGRDRRPLAPTLYELTGLMASNWEDANGHPRYGHQAWGYVHKDVDDGSDEIFWYLRKTNISPRRFKVCGVNLDYCVLYTVQGLAAKYKNTEITVIKDAVGGADHQPRDWNSYNGIKNAIVKELATA